MSETTTRPDRTVLTDKISPRPLSRRPSTRPIGKIDIADWLRTLPDREYQRWAPPDQRQPGIPPPTTAAPCPSTWR